VKDRSRTNFLLQEEQKEGDESVWTETPHFSKRGGEKGRKAGES
jgi:hypothetical protein